MRYLKFYRLPVLILALIVLMSLGFAGCGSEGGNAADKSSGTTKAAAAQPAAQSQKAEPKDVTLTVWTGPDWKGVFSSSEENAQEGDWFKHVAKNFAAANPNDKITVNVEVIAYADMIQKLNIAVASNSSPDVWSYSHFNIYEYINQGAVIPLNDIITPEVKSYIPEAVWAASSSNGEVYFYPFAALPTGLAVNKTLFEKPAPLTNSHSTGKTGIGRMKSSRKH